MSYDFTGGRISRFPIDFFMGLTTEQRYIALPVINLYSPCGSVDRTQIYKYAKTNIFLSFYDDEQSCIH